MVSSGLRSSLFIRRSYKYMYIGRRLSSHVILKSGVCQLCVWSMLRIILGCYGSEQTTQRTVAFRTYEPQALPVFL